MIIEYLTPTKSKSIWSICLPLPLRSFCAPFDQLKAHLTDFLRAYNFARRLKTLKGLPPYEYLCKLWTQTPDRFTLNQSIKCRD